MPDREEERKRANERFRKMAYNGLFGDLLIFSMRSTNDKPCIQSVKRSEEAWESIRQDEEMSEIWQSKDGRRILIEEMDDRWLYNAIDYLEKKARERGVAPERYHVKYSSLIEERDRRIRKEKASVENVKMKLQRRLERGREKTPVEEPFKEESPKKKNRPNRLERAIDLD